MRVMVFVKATAETEAGVLPSAELLEAMGKFNQLLIDAGVMREGDGLKPSSHGARVSFSSRGLQVTDGPFAETKELVAGYWVWQVSSLQEAIEWAKRCPNPMQNNPGSGEVPEAMLEIRPFYELEDFGEVLSPELRAQEDRLRAQLGQL